MEKKIKKKGRNNNEKKKIENMDLMMQKSKDLIIKNLLNMNDITILKEIGNGSLADVFLVQKNDDQKIYSMKVRTN